MTLGQFIRKTREEQGTSLRELASKLKVSAAYLSDIELGRRHPSDKVLSDIARLLNVPVETLRKHDMRAPVDEIRRLANADPAFGLAFRKLVAKNLSSEELLRIVEAVRKRKQKK